MAKNKEKTNKFKINKGQLRIGAEHGICCFK